MGLGDTVKDVAKDVLPDILFSLGTIAKTFLKNPLRLFAAVIAAIVLAVANGIAGVVNEAVLILEVPPKAVGGLLKGVTAPVTQAAFGVLSTWNAAMAYAVVGAGPAAPIVMVVLYAAEAYVVYRLLMLVPGVGTAKRYVGGLV